MVADHRELMQGGNDAPAERCLADEAEDRYQDEQKRIDGGEPVPRKADDKQSALVIAIFFDDPVRRSGYRVVALPPIETS